MTISNIGTNKKRKKSNKKKSKRSARKSFLVQEEFYKESLRGYRRRCTEKIAKKRRDAHLKLIHGNDSDAIDCVCELVDTYFAKRRAILEIDTIF